MYNWSVDTTRLKKNSRADEIFELEQMINFGLDGQKLSEKMLRLYWPELKIDPNRKKYLARLLWPEKYKD